jgi:hypothetical protein
MELVNANRLIRYIFGSRQKLNYPQQCWRDFAGIKHSYEQIWIRGAGRKFISNVVS